MRPLRDLGDEMRYKAMALDAETADRLFAGRIAPDDAPPGFAGVALLVEALSADGGGGVDPVATAIATGLAFAAGYASIAFLLRFLVTHTTAVFVIYRIALGALVLALLSAGAIS
jgi:hypothetical protein